MNTITTMHNIFTMRIFIMIGILIRKKWMGYYKIMRENQFSTRRKIKRIMNMFKKKMTLRI